ncbi:MAG: glycosyltransferase family 8 protein [Clostridia bacterium]|nr:glycosyltransferase family 8 protein [Clostridia bacterium]
MSPTKVPIFFSCDDNYIPFLGVAIKSLIENTSMDNEYFIFVLHSKMSIRNMKIITAMEKENVSICFIDVSEKLIKYGEKLNLRDYYTVSIYFRIFIPDMFPEFKKAIYLDADMVILEDIAKLYNIELGGNLLAGVPDAIIASRQEFRDYAELGCGIYPYTKYFNSGMMLMNLDAMREFGLEGKFEHLFNTYRFETVCPDQDYLNVICKDRVLYIDEGWDKMAIDGSYENPMIVHYNNFAKPWQQDGINYADQFWKYAKDTPYYEEIMNIRRNFNEEKLLMQAKGGEELVKSTIRIVNSDKNFKKTLFDTGIL